MEPLKYQNGGEFESSGSWIHGERRIESNEIMYVTGGCVYIEEDGIQYELHKDDMLFLEHGRLHRGTRKSENVCFYWFHFSGGTPAVKLLHADSDRLAGLIRQLFHYENTPAYPRRVLDLMLELILTEIEVCGSGQPADRLVLQICEWIKLNSGRRILISEISDSFKYNSDYLSRLFKKQKGISLKGYIEMQRISYIKRALLASDKNISEVALICGFSDYQSFLKFFTYHEKASPMEFRNAFYGKHMNNR